MAWSIRGWKIVAFVITFIILSISIYDILWNVGENRCEMTWMYQWPQFIKVDLPSHVQQQFSKYSLFIYGEGDYADYLRSMKGNFRLNGIPVVFVHGNAGRYKQVRSPGSVSISKSAFSRYHFNYFSVDYQEELSALYGPFLTQQTEYLSHCIMAILQCYSHLKEKPQSVIAIGHSMGGLVIRGLFALPHFNPTQINTVINLATPQTKPIITLDSALYSYYNLVNTYWRENAKTKLRNVSTVSLGGGVRDYLVRSDLCFLHDISNNSNHISILTTSIPTVWRSTDHQCIVWCNELVRFETRMFFKMIDSDTGFVTANHSLRADIIQNLFYNTNHNNDLIRFPSTCTTIYAKQDITSYTSRGKGCYQIRFEGTNHSAENQVVYIWVKEVISNWAYLCRHPFNDCQHVNSTEFLPSYATSPASTVASFNTLHDYIILCRFSKKVTFFVQIMNERTTLMNLPIIFPKQFHVSHNSFYLAYDIPLFTETWQVYDVTVNRDGNKESDIVGNFYSSWSGENEYFIFDQSNQLFQLKIFQGKPSTDYHDKFIQLRFWGENLNTMKFTVKPNFFGSFGQLLRFNIENMIRYVIIFGLLRSCSCNLMENCYNQVVCRIHITKYHLLLLLLILLKLFIVFCSTMKMIPLTLRNVLPQIYLVTLSMMTSELVRVILYNAIYFIMLISYPIPRVLNFLESRFTISRLKIEMNGMVLDWCYVFLLSSLLSAYYFETMNLGMILMFLLYYHILKIQTTDNKNAKEFHLNVLLGIFPVIVIFSIVTVITVVKDLLEGFAPQYVAFLHLQLLIVSYVFYLATGFDNFSGTSMKSDFLCRSIIYLKFSVILVILSCSLTLVPLYWLTYATVYSLFVVTISC